MNLKIVGLSLFLFSSPVFSLPEIQINQSSQSYKVLDKGKILKFGPVSTGKKGHLTPKGNFSIHTKYYSVKSKKYNALMQYAMFFKGSLYAIHQGNLPGYPASHGCVRVLKKDAKFLFSMLPIGTKVIIK